MTYDDVALGGKVIGTPRFKPRSAYHLKPLKDRRDRSLEIVTNAVIASNEYELANTELKRQYLVKMIELYNDVVKDISGFAGSFGTGYPFYTLNTDLSGELPIIEEQLDYNRQLQDAIIANSSESWICKKCLNINSSRMPDLKVMCKQCSKVDSLLKPRKVINRLPDMDLWMVCHNGDIERAKRQVVSSLRHEKFTSSDKNPVRTIRDVKEIATDLKEGRMPNKFVPIDTHIIDYDTLLSLIEQIPDALEKAVMDGEKPYLPIHPISYRKTWQKDDEPYNFVHDYLSSLKEFNFEPNLRAKLMETRRIIAKLYTIEQLYDFLIQTGPDSVLRRHKCPTLRKTFERKVSEWQQ